MKRIPKYLSNKEILLKYRKIDLNTNCWLWTRTIFKGYGRVKIKGKMYLVHRLSYETFIGPLKNYALHKPECPNKRCFNPEHLYDGDQYNNMDDVVKLGNHHNESKTHCLNGHEFDYVFPLSGKRGCKTCQKERLSNYYQNKKKLGISKSVKNDLA